MKYNPINRRMFLQGVGGTLAIPLLSSLLPRAAYAAAAQSPQRLVMMLGMLGRDIEQWYPTLTDAQMQMAPGVLYKRLSEVTGPMSFILGSEFDPLRNKMNIVRGLDSLQPTGHNSWVPTTACGGHPSAADAFGYSIDCVLEESSAFYPNAPAVGVIRSVPYRDQGGRYSDFASWSYTSKSVRGEHLPAEWDPYAIYAQLFDPSALSKRAVRSGRIVTATNAVYDGFKAAMNNRRISSLDKYKLDAYMQQLSQVDAQLKITTPRCDQAGVPARTFTTNEAMQSAMIDLEVAALACGITKVVMHSLIQWQSALALPGDYHAAAHGASSLKATDGVGPSQAAVYNKWMMTRVAEMMRKLDAVAETDGTLLDNTLFIYANEDSTGSHDHRDLPVLVAGAKNKLRGGYFMDYRPRPLVKVNPYSATALGRPYNQLLVTAFKALGLSEKQYQKFGQPGFGRYDNIPDAAAKHYQPFLGASVNDPLPFLWAA